MPDRLSEENKNLVKEVFGPSNLLNSCGATSGTSTASEVVNVIEELDHKEANEILLRASSAKVCKRVKLIKIVTLKIPLSMQVNKVNDNHTVLKKLLSKYSMKVSKSSMKVAAS